MVITAIVIMITVIVITIIAMAKMILIMVIYIFVIVNSLIQCITLKVQFVLGLSVSNNMLVVL